MLEHCRSAHLICQQLKLSCPHCKQAALGVVGEFDLLSKGLLGSGDAFADVLCLAYCSDCSMLVALTMVRACHVDVTRVSGLVAV